MPALRIDVWSDIACPWCYIGKRHLEQALAAFPHRAEVDVVWRSFELDPGAPRVLPAEPPMLDRLAAKYRVAPAQAQAMVARVRDAAARAGLAMQLERVRGGNTFDGHRVLHLARARGAQDAAKERLMRAYFVDGEALGEPEVLVRLAGEAGLDVAEVRAVVGSDRFAADVRQDEALARELGISGVPFYVLAGRIGVSGAQPAEVLRGALDQAWAAADGDAIADGAACGPDGCA
jgi:predicted DsbA family dithiol-disulfide isomerase